MRLIVIILLLFCITCQEVEIKPKVYPRPVFFQIPGDPFAVTFFGNIFIRPSEYQRFMKQDTVYDRAVMLHEITHVKRQIAYGDMVLWHTMYAMNKGFKWEEERIAYEVEIAYMLSNNQGIYPDWYVETLSGPLYDKMVSKEECQKWINNFLKQYNYNGS